MLSKKILCAAALAGGCFAAAPVQADSGPGGFFTSTAAGHAPIGVMGDHMHKSGEWMIGARVMHMEMEGLRFGTDELTPEQAVTSIPNVHFGKPGQPALLRVVPQEMQMDMLMVGLMYAPSDWLTLMASGRYVRKEMDALTFQGMMGTTRLGTFNMTTEGFGDTVVTGLVRLYEDAHTHVHLNAGLSLPTGSITESATMLTPMNMRMTMRAGYGMQLGSGTYDLLPGITYVGRTEDYSWGAQLGGTLHLGRNDEGYTLGDAARLTAWVSREWAPWISTSVRVAGEHVGQIDGQDDQIVGPSPAANPLFSGGERVELFAGVNLMAQSGALKGHRLAFEIGTPVYEDVNGLQMERDLVATIGWQKSF